MTPIRLLGWVGRLDTASLYPRIEFQFDAVRPHDSSARGDTSWISAQDRQLHRVRDYHDAALHRYSAPTLDRHRPYQTLAD